MKLFHTYYIEVTQFSYLVYSVHIYISTYLKEKECWEDANRGEVEW